MTTAPVAVVVERVIDGDTFVLKGNGETIRLIGVDTPEVPWDCYGTEAQGFTRSLLPAGTALTLTYDKDRRDRYGRTLAYAYRGTTFVNGELMRQGYAKVMTIGRNTKYEADFRSLESQAKAAKVGRWGACEAGGSTTTVPPTTVPEDDDIGRPPWSTPPTEVTTTTAPTTTTTVVPALEPIVVPLPENWDWTSPCHGTYPGACLVTEMVGPDGLVHPVVYDPEPYPGWPAPPAG